MIKIGPAGLGPVKTAFETLEEYKSLGFKNCEIAFTYGPYIKQEDAIKIGEKAKELGISLSIHAPYFVNLSSKDEEIRQKSMLKILKCCEIGHYLGAKTVVFHPGYYLEGEGSSHVLSNNGGTKTNNVQTLALVTDAINQMMSEVEKNEWKILLAPESMGKVNVFGSIDEIKYLVENTGCYFCLDFAHILARDKKVDYAKIISLFGKKKSWHVHFSGINYTEKGEKSHKETTVEEWTELFLNLPKDVEITIVNESPVMIDDCVKGLEILKKI
jgi:deoxyribonuclease-4